MQDLRRLLKIQVILESFKFQMWFFATTVDGLRALDPLDFELVHVLELLMDHVLLKT